MTDPDYSANIRESKLYSKPADTNKEHICSALKQILSVPSTGSNPNTLLEVASGTGQHIVYLAEKFPDIHFQPSDFLKHYLESICCYIQESGLPNISQPVEIDIRTSYTTWDGGKFSENSISFILCVNMIHITKFECVEGLFRNSGCLLKTGGMLFVHGPLAFNDFASQTSSDLNKSLKSLNPDWGVRNLEDLNELAIKNNLKYEVCQAIPDDDYLTVWRKVI